MKTIELDETDSTNEYCKRIDDGADLMVTALKQNGGRGTKGRSFASESGGLYLSVMRHYQNYPAEQTFKIMVNACVAVCRAVEKVGFKPVIRWANDVLVNGKKISGTLIENSFCGNKIVRSIVGVGINVNNPLPAELENIATSLCAELGKSIDLGEFKSSFIELLQREYTIDDYKSYMPWLGGEVTLKTRQNKVVRALDVSADGRLLVQDGENRVLISAAEVSLRL